MDRSCVMYVGRFQTLLQPLNSFLTPVMESRFFNIETMHFNIFKTIILTFNSFMMEITLCKSNQGLLTKMMFSVFNK